MPARIVSNRREPVMIYATGDEKDVIDRAAHRVGMQRSAFMRSASLALARRIGANGGDPDALSGIVGDLKTEE